MPWFWPSCTFFCFHIQWKPTRNALTRLSETVWIRMFTWVVTDCLYDTYMTSAKSTYTFFFVHPPNKHITYQRHGLNFCKMQFNLSRDKRFPTMWFVRPAKPQISLRIRAVWSEPLLVAWISNECQATDWTSFGVSKLKRRLHRLTWVHTCQNATLLEITCHGSFDTCIRPPVYHLKNQTEQRHPYLPVQTNLSLYLCLDLQYIHT